MANPSHQLDGRSAVDIVRDLHSRLGQTQPGWPASPPTRGAAAALIAVFARYCEVVIERLNAAPERKMLGFLQRLGASQLPPQAARVPLTFSLAQKATTDVFVPKGAQAAAPAGPERSGPVIFETEDDLVVSAIRLDQLLTKDPARDQYADRSGLLTGSADQPALGFSGETQADHALHIGHSTFFGIQPLDKLVVIFDLAASLPARPQQNVLWDLHNGTNTLRLVPESDGTAGFTGSGRVVFRSVPLAAGDTLNGHHSQWLSCRTTGAFAGRLIFRNVTLERRITSPERPSPAGLVNGTPVDLTKDFLPLTDKPKFGTTFYLAIDPTLSIPDMTVTVRITLVNPAGTNNPLPGVNATRKARIAWEFWEGSAWVTLGTGQGEQDVEDAATHFSDTTRALTKSGDVHFRLPSSASVLNLSGVKSAWLRARLIGGDYGEELSYVLKTPPGPQPEYVMKPPTLAPPWIHAVTLSYALEEAGEAPQWLLSENDFSLREGPPVSSQRPSFEPFAEPGASLYLGLQPPAVAAGGAAIAGQRPFHFYFLLAESARLFRSSEPAVNVASLTWEYWNGETWAPLQVQDATSQLTRSGPVLFLTPSDFQPRSELNLTRFWIRVVAAAGAEVLPIARVLTNTVDARQTITIRNEILGSSNGTPGQFFRVARPPVLAGSVLDVRERDGWATWAAVPNFYMSTREDRHYAIDRLTGEIQFGDGINGQMPPAGSNNIRMNYQTGGGAAGNLPARSIVQLKTTFPSVDKVSNLRGAEGGADAENLDALISRAPAVLRHRGRAVAATDYEDLAKLSTPEVALALGVPLRDLATDPDGKRLEPGTVSVIVVPHSASHRPMPGVELIERVQSYLEARKSPSAKVVVLGPEYLGVTVKAEVALVSGERLSAVDEAARRAIADFLDPLHGGPDGAGWSFGRRPHRSDLYTILHAIDDVDHVVTLNMTLIEERPGAGATGRSLVYPGPLELRYSLV